MRRARRKLAVDGWASHSEFGVAGDVGVLGQ
jgi:hypothetical protein